MFLLNLFYHYCCH